MVVEPLHLSTEGIVLDTFVRRSVLHIFLQANAAPHARTVDTDGSGEQLGGTAGRGPRARPFVTNNLTRKLSGPYCIVVVPYKLSTNIQTIDNLYSSSSEVW